MYFVTLAALVSVAVAVGATTTTTTTTTTTPGNPPVTTSAATPAGTPDDGIGPITVTVTSNVLTVKFVAPAGKFNLVSFHMMLDKMITVPEQGTIASPDLHAPQDYKDGAFVWSGPVIGKTEADLKGKPIYYWVRVEESGLGKNGIPKKTTIG